MHIKSTDSDASSLRKKCASSCSVRFCGEEFQDRENLSSCNGPGLNFKAHPNQSAKKELELRNPGFPICIRTLGAQSRVQKEADSR